MNALATPATAMTAADVNKYVGEKVREARKKRGMTRSALAAGVGLSGAWVTLVETGQRGLSAVRIVAVCTVLGVNPADLLPVVVVPGG